jgi:hypothetical protein
MPASVCADDKDDKRLTRREIGCEECSLQRSSVVGDAVADEA